EHLAGTGRRGVAAPAGAAGDLAHPGRGEPPAGFRLRLRDGARRLLRRRAALPAVVPAQPEAQAPRALPRAERL
ncbi:MAG: hypothetical protein AVDCRST_MAG61-235, partial [uncultured Friedmanniella sp.]